MTQIFEPADDKHWLDLRKKDVTSTEAAALFGLSPYMTHFELWHRKHDNLDVEFEVNERMRWGTRLQDSIAAGIAEDQQWKIRRMNEYIRDEELRAGASFDFEYTQPWDKPMTPVEHLTGILEVKNVDSLAFRDGWIVDGENVEAPPHIEIQVQQQLMLSGKRHAYIGALIGGNRVVLIKREPDQVVIESIKQKIKAFWESVSNNTPPTPDFSKDAEFIAHLYSYAEPGKVFNADERVAKLAFAYKQTADEAKAATEKKEAIKAEILTIICDAEKILGPTFTISAGMIGPAHVEYERGAYRNFKITWKKQK